MNTVYNTKIGVTSYIDNKVQYFTANERDILQMKIMIFNNKEIDET